MSPVPAPDAPDAEAPDVVGELRLSGWQRLFGLLGVVAVIATAAATVGALTGLRQEVATLDARAEVTTSLIGVQVEVDRAARHLLEGRSLQDALVSVGLATRHQRVAINGVMDPDRALLSGIGDELSRLEAQLEAGERDAALQTASALSSDVRTAFSQIEQRFFADLDATRSGANAASWTLAVLAVAACILGLLFSWRVRAGWRDAHRHAYADLVSESRRRSEVEREQVAQARQLEVYTRELVAANRQLEAANKLKNDFVSTVSHELRTPITAIGGLASTMVNNWDRLTEGHRRDFVQRIQRQARRQERLVDDLLTMSRIVAGELVTTPQVLAPLATVVEVVEDLSLAVDVDIAPDLRVLVDADHLYRIVANFLTNAAKYGHPPFRVEAEVVATGIEVRVIDRGDGVPPAFVEHLFDDFKQASSGDTRTARGVGLGLSIVRALVEANQGQVFHRPVHPHGACFGAVLRAARAATPETDPAQGQPGVAIAVPEQAG